MSGVASRFDAALHDWRIDGDDEKSSVEPLSFTGKVGCLVDGRAYRVDVELPDGRALWIEQQDGVLIVHAYDCTHDEPVNLHIHQDKIEVDAFDRFGIPVMTM